MCGVEATTLSGLGWGWGDHVTGAQTFMADNHVASNRITAVVSELNDGELLRLTSLPFPSLAYRRRESPQLRAARRRRVHLHARTAAAQLSARQLLRRRPRARRRLILPRQRYAALTPPG